jgi:hypothetical protein
MFGWTDGRTSKVSKDTGQDMTAVESSTCITHLPGLSIILRPAPELQGRPKDEQVPRCGDMAKAVHKMFHANKGSPVGLGMATKVGALMKGQVKWRVRDIR